MKWIHEEETWLQSDLTSSPWFVCIVMELVPWGWLFGVELALHLKFLPNFGGTFIVRT
jgi:hypothetical protein